MSNDTIYRQDAIDAILDLSDFGSVIELFEYVEDHDLQGSRSGGIIDAIDAVLLLPSVQPERNTGRWINDNCSECGQYVFHGDARNFCPNCGADMRGEQNG